jgi:glycosyltransferase involved in cell wall biosynthesis
MGRFLREAIDSVLTQDYAPIEYLIRDAGSTDGTLEILTSSRVPLNWVSEPDSGVADALRKSFDAAGGEIFGWVNSDDRLLPGAVASAVRALEEHPEAVAVYGNALWIDERGEVLGRYPTEPFNRAQLGQECFICQPACLFRAAAYRRCGGINATLGFAFDYDLWMRLSEHGSFVHVPETWAHSRMHAANKTLGNRREVFAESMNVIEKHFGHIPFRWIYSDLCYKLDRRDQFFDGFRPSIRAYLASLPAGLRRNRNSRARYAREWLAAMSWGGLQRQVLGRILK